MSTPFALVLVGAGSGQRLGRPEPKALVPAGGKPLYQHCLDTAARLEGLTLVVLVLPETELHGVGRTAVLAHPGAALKLVAGGTDRSRSVVAGVRAAAHTGQAVLVHDVARPLATPALFHAVAHRLSGQTNLCAVPLLPIDDALKRAEGGRVIDAPNRAGYFATQTPQGLTADLAAKLAHDHDGVFMDEGSWALSAGAGVVGVPGERPNRKITHPEDLSWLDFVILNSKSGEL